MIAGSRTPIWVRVLRFISVLLGIAALIRGRIRALDAVAMSAVSRPRYDADGDPLPGRP
ncbi:hypothetical protein [Nocardia sp. NPDC051570]|uniref:hypothetical protein n=1 Tax=Nocardia sp. NPDC051570 TaxID=3364324 RepID=UPI0037954A35